MCRVLEASPSGFYDWLRRPESQRAAEDRALIEKIQAVHNESRRTYGSPRVHASLKAAGYRIGRKRVARLMRENDIRPRTKRKFKVTTDSRHDHPIAPNLLDRQFTVEAPNTVWLADLSYIWTREGWLYLAVVLDLFSRQVVGWAMDEQMPQELTLAALDMALKRRRPLPGLMHHSDRGQRVARRRKRQGSSLSPSVNYVTRTEFGPPRSSIRLRTWAATATSVARASSLWKRSPSPITCFQRANWPSIPAL